MLFENYNPLEGRMLQVVDENGRVNVELKPTLYSEVLLKAYRTMILTRVADEKAVRLQRQGRLGAYPPSKGQEASQIGPALALQAEDWIVPGFRELGALLWRGVPLWRMYLFWMGNEEGSVYLPDVRVMPTVVPVGDQILHGVGISYASMIRKEKSVAMVYFGDGGSSEGSFHEGLNFAGVLKTPTVFVCQNNQYAISMPRSRQTASRTIAQKALAYGFPGILVDGNDVLALYLAANEAVERARRGEGPTLIESYTYRIGDHTTSDDANRYRKEEELKEWEGRDPLKRLRIYLKNEGLWSEELEKAAWADAQSTVDEESNRALSQPEPSIEDIFKFTYKEMPPELAEQLEFLKGELERKGG